MGCWRGNGGGRWHNTGVKRGRNGSWCGPRHAAGSGNSAFDEYREETLRRLEEEQEEFQSFLERLRKAKDKAEFDQFMAEQRNGGGSSRGPEGPEPQPQA